MAGRKNKIVAQSLVTVLILSMAAIPSVASAPAVAALEPANTNLLLNPGFESGDLASPWGITNWTKVGVVATSPLIARSTAFAYSGTSSVKFTDLTSAYGGRGILSDPVSITAGYEYTFGGWVYVPAKPAPAAPSEVMIRFRIQWFDAAGTKLREYPTVGTALANYNTWEKRELVDTAPARAVTARLLIQAYEKADRKHDLYIDDAYIIRLPVPVTLTSTIIEAPTEVRLGETFTVTWSVKNESPDLPATGVKVYSYLYTYVAPVTTLYSTGPWGANAEIIDLAPGETRVLTQSITVRTDRDPTDIARLRVRAKYAGVNYDDTWYNTVVKPAKVSLVATVDIDPDTLNLKSSGQWITAYISLPSGYDVEDIDLASVKLNGTLPRVGPIDIGDYNGDGVPDLMVKFGSSAVQGLVSVGDATLTVSGGGLSADGRVEFDFVGSDTIRVISPGKGPK